MKRGKNVKLNVSPFVKSLYGTVDHSDFKSFFINIRTWVLPKSDSENWKSVVGHLSKNIKNSVSSKINKSVLYENFILDVDLRASGLDRNKRSFMSIEITLYPKVKESFKSPLIKSLSESIVQDIIKDCFLNDANFDFFVSKKN
jgi:hypothetical protein